MNILNSMPYKLIKKSDRRELNIKGKNNVIRVYVLLYQCFTTLYLGYVNRLFNDITVNYISLLSTKKAGYQADLLCNIFYRLTPINDASKSSQEFQCSNGTDK